MSSFAFRQRAGHVDWKAITSVRSEEILKKSDTKQLQNVLDSATFCEFRPEDVRNNSIESVAQLVNILQFISEYLLHCQEAQFKVIRDMQLKSDKSKESIDKLKKENLALKEDRKIYQRQLAMLRKSLGPDYFLNNQASSSRDVRAPVVTHLLNPEPKQPEHRNMDVEVIESILKHEGETRSFMTTMLNEQRAVFMEQIRSISDSVRAAQDPATKENVARQANAADLTSKLQSQMESSLQKAVEAMQNTVSQAIATMAEEQHKTSTAVAALRVTAAATAAPAAAAPTKSESTHRADVQIALQTAALELFEQELARREKALERKEREVSMRDDAARGSQELTQAARRASDNERLSLLTANEAIAMNAFSIAARVVFNTIKHALIRKKRTAWQHWYTVVLNHRDTENSATQAKLLVYAKDQRSLRESELQLLLDAERDKVEAALAKQSSLLRDLSKAEAKLADIAAEKDRDAPREADLERLLQAEREKVIVSTAKFNTLKSRADREIASLQEKLQGAEDAAMFARLEGKDPAPRPVARAGAGALSISTPSFVTGNTTALSPVSPVSSVSKYAPPPLHLRQSLQRQYISSEASEQDLFTRVQRKLAGRKTSEEIEAEAMSQLAQEITARMSEQGAQ